MRTKYLYMIPALLLMVAGCERRPLEMPVDVAFRVGFEGMESTKTVSDGSAATQLLVGVMDEEENSLQATTVSRSAGNIFQFSLSLVEGMSYKVLFLAQSPGRYVSGGFTSANQLKAVPLTGTGTMNSEVDDAYAGVYEVSADGASTVSVTLSRICAQVNLGTTSSDDASAVTLALTGVPNSYNVLLGTASGTQGWSASGVPLADAVLTEGGVDYKWLGYVFVPIGTGEVTSSLSLSITRGGTVDSSEIASVPLRANYRTNIIGEL